MGRFELFVNEPFGQRQTYDVNTTWVIPQRTRHPRTGVMQVKGFRLQIPKHVAVTAGLTKDENVIIGAYHEVGQRDRIVIRGVSDGIANLFGDAEERRTWQSSVGEKFISLRLPNKLTRGWVAKERLAVDIKPRSLIRADGTTAIVGIGVRLPGILFDVRCADYCVHTLRVRGSKAVAGRIVEQATGRTLMPLPSLYEAQQALHELLTQEDDRPSAMVRLHG